MPVDWNAEVVDQIQSHWRFQLRPRWDGLTDDEYFWQPVPGCWTVSPRGRSAAPISMGGGDFTWDYGEPGPDEPVTTIAWRIADRTAMVSLPFNSASTIPGARLAVSVRVR